MEKPQLIVSGNDHFSDEELFDLSDTLSSVFDVKTYRFEEYVADELIPYLRLIFNNPITKGFLQTIGRDLWDSIKKKIANIAVKKKIESDVEFRFENEKMNISFRCRSNTPEVIESAFDKVIDVLKIVEQSKQREAQFIFNVVTNKWEVV